MSCLCTGSGWTLSKFEKEAKKTRAALSLMKAKRTEEASAYNAAFLTCRAQALVLFQKNDRIGAIIQAQEALLNQQQAKRILELVQYIIKAQGKIDTAYSAGLVLEDNSKISRMFEGMTGTDNTRILEEAADIIEESGEIKQDFKKIMDELQTMANAVKKEDKEFILSQEEAETVLEQWSKGVVKKEVPIARPEQYVMSASDD